MNLDNNKLGENYENMKLLIGITKQLPSNLKSLKLNFEENRLGGNSDNLKYIGEALI